MFEDLQLDLSILLFAAVVHAHKNAFLPLSCFLVSLPAACTEAAVGVMVEPLKLRFGGNANTDARDAFISEKKE